NSSERWLERKEFVSDDLDLLFFHQFQPQVPTHQITCEWTFHAHQLNRLIREPFGGINPFRATFHISHPLRFKSYYGNLMDEYKLFKDSRVSSSTTIKIKKKLLLVGELAYNQDRVLALAERGYELYGLWVRDPEWYNTVGPLPFGS